MNETYRLRNALCHAQMAASDALTGAIGREASGPVAGALQHVLDLAEVFDQRLAIIEYRLGDYQEAPSLALNWPSSQRIVRLSRFADWLRRCSRRWRNVDPASITAFVREQLQDGPKVAGGNLIGLHYSPANADGDELVVNVVRTPINGG